jgi:hypothetical protein
MYKTMIAAALTTVLFCLSGCGASSTPSWMDARTGRPWHGSSSLAGDHGLALDRTSGARTGEARAERASMHAASR